MAVARSGVAAAPPIPILISATVPSSPRLSAYATAMLEMSSKRRLAILWKARQRGQRPRHQRRLLISSSGRRSGLAVAGEVVGQPDRPLPRRGGQHQRRVQGEQHGQ